MTSCDDDDDDYDVDGDLFIISTTVTYTIDFLMKPQRNHAFVMDYTLLEWTKHKITSVYCSDFWWELYGNHHQHKIFKPA